MLKNETNRRKPKVCKDADKLREKLKDQPPLLDEEVRVELDRLEEACRSG